MEIHYIGISKCNAVQCIKCCFEHGLALGLAESRTNISVKAQTYQSQADKSYSLLALHITG